MVPLCAPTFAEYDSEPRLTVTSKMSLLHPPASGAQASATAQAELAKPKRPMAER